MEPLSPGMIAGIVLKTLASAKAVMGSYSDKRKNHRVERLTVRLDTSSDAFLLSGIAALCQKMTHLEQVSVGQFLRSIEGELFVRSVAAAVLTGENESILEGLRNELRALLAIYAEFNKAQQETAADALIGIFVTTFRKAAAEIRKLDFKYYQQLVNRAYQEASAGSLRSAPQRAALITGLPQFDRLSLETLIRRYKVALHHSTAYLVPAYFDKQRRVPINKIYVTPKFELHGDASPYHADTDVSSITLAELLDNLHRAVVLGDPGAGKSTLSQKIAHDLSDGSDDHKIVPFVVPLRKYDERRQQYGHSVIEFLSFYINERHQVPIAEHMLQTLFLTGRALIIFDGVDELLEISRRRDMVESIENFAQLYSTCRIIATSREVEYHTTPIDPGSFRTHVLNRFQDSDVEEYATQWFAIDDRLESSEKDLVARAFIEESHEVADLRSNPLMLGLLCNVYRGPRSIPQTRAELYERCAIMLFEEWDRSRGIKVSGPLKADVKGALRDIALWVYTNPSLANGVPENLLRKRIRAYWKKRFDNEDVADQEARELIKLWKGRSWVLSDVGPTKDGKQLRYSFTHRTFLEYFAGIELERKNPSPKRLWGILKNWLSVGQGEIVGQIAIQTLEEAYDDAGNTIAKLLVADIRDMSLDEESRLNLLSFCARNIDSLALSADVLRQITDEAVSACVIGISRVSPPGRPVPAPVSGSISTSTYAEESPDSMELMEPLMRLVCYPSQFGSIVRARLADRCLNILLSEDIKAAAAAYLLLEREEEFRVVAANRRSHEVIDEKEIRQADSRQWRSQLGAETLNQLVRRWCGENFWAGVIATRNGDISVREAIKMSTLDLLMCSDGPFEHQVGLVGRSMCLLEAIVRQFLALDCSRIPSSFILDESEMQETLRVIAFKLREERSWLDGSWLNRTSVGSEVVKGVYLGAKVDLVPGDENKSHLKEATDDADAMFAAAFLVAALAEWEEWEIIDLSSDQVADLQLGRLKSLESVFHARFEPSFRVDGQTALRESKLKPQDAELMRAWMVRKWSFLWGNR